MLYYFKVRGYNSVGDGLESVPVSATPQLIVVLDIITNIEYNAAGLKEKIFYGNGNTTEYTYDDNLRVTRIWTHLPNNESLQDLSYIYDGVGNVLTTTDAVNTASQNFNYDAQGRLAQAEGAYGFNQPWMVTKGFNYDISGNLLEKDANPYTYGDGTTAGIHAVTAVGNDLTYNYDANGNLTKETDTGVPTDYVYDFENRLERVEKNSTTVARYEYDDQGMRTKKIVGPNATIFVGDLYERKGGVSTIHLYADGIRLASLKGDELLYFYGNHLGSTNVVADEVG